MTEHMAKDYQKDTRSTAPAEVSVVVQSAEVTTDVTHTIQYQLEQINLTLLLINYQLTLITGEDE